MSEIIIDIRNASKRFKENIVFHDVSLSFEKGKIYGLIGRNGSGKTVLFKCICGFMPLTSGTIMVGGKIVGKDIDIPRNIGMIIEAPGFLPQYSGLKNLMMLASLRMAAENDAHNTKHRCEKDLVSAVMKEVGLDPDSKKRVGKYSLGMKQRLAIAQAIMDHPTILILDEPTSGLDNSGVEDVRALLQTLRASGTTILLASHNVEDIKTLCDAAYRIDNGMLSCVEIA